MDHFTSLVGPARIETIRSTAGRLRELLDGRTLWVINSTGRGGGVAEMLHELLPYALGFGINVRWAVINGDREFFNLTKRLCNRIYGVTGDGGELGAAERLLYERTNQENARQFLALTRPGDVVIVTDPQPAGLVDPLRRAGHKVIWRCHLGRDSANPATELGWAFLRPYIESADAFVFSTAKHVLAGVDPARTWLVSPSINPFSAKNADLSPEVARAVLAAVGLVEGTAGDGLVVDLPQWRRVHVKRPVTVVRAGRAPSVATPLVTQVSRWDRLKDMGGVMTGFAEYVDRSLDARLLLVGPEVTGVADDPEAAEMFEECRAAWAALPGHDRRRIDLACVPMADLDENALVVNAIQRHSRVVVQKSLAEGFGLTITEAMWKARPTVGSAVGGIVDQIVHDKNGLLLDDPADLRALGGYVTTLLTDGDYAGRLGAAARRTVIDRFLNDRHLLRWAEILEQIESGHPGHPGRPATTAGDPDG